MPSSGLAWVKLALLDLESEVEMLEMAKIVETTEMLEMVETFEMVEMVDIVGSLELGVEVVLVELVEVGWVEFVMLKSIYKKCKLNFAAIE